MTDYSHIHLLVGSSAIPKMTILTVHNSILEAESTKINNIHVADIRKDPVRDDDDAL